VRIRGQHGDAFSVALGEADPRALRDHRLGAVLETDERRERRCLRIAFDLQRTRAGAREQRRRFHVHATLAFLFEVGGHVRFRVDPRLAHRRSDCFERAVGDREEATQLALRADCERHRADARCDGGHAALGPALAHRRLGVDARAFAEGLGRDEHRRAFRRAVHVDARSRHRAVGSVCCAVVAQRRRRATRAGEAPMRRGHLLHARGLREQRIAAASRLELCRRSFGNECEQLAFLQGRVDGVRVAKLAELVVACACIARSERALVAAQRGHRSAVLLHRDARGAIAREPQFATSDVEVLRCRRVVRADAKVVAALCAREEEAGVAGRFDEVLSFAIGDAHVAERARRECIGI